MIALKKREEKRIKIITGLAITAVVLLSMAGAMLVSELIFAASLV